MFCDKGLNNKINHIHEKALRIACKNNVSDFDTLLIENSYVSIYKRKPPLLMIEIYQTVHKLNPSFMNEIFIQKSSHYHLRNSRLMQIPKTRTITHEIESLSYLGFKLWNNLPENMKNLNTLNTFKFKIKQWKDNCNCRLGRTFVAQVGFLT